MDNERERHEQQLASKKAFQEENARRIDQLIELVELHTRTERHLEQHSNISALENLRHALKVQEEREEEIKNLRNIIAYGKHDKENEMENIMKNYIFTDRYLQHHGDHMDNETLDATVEKQEHRREQLSPFK